MNIISLTQEEFTENVDFAFKLASKGHSLKIKTNDNIVLLVTAVIILLIGVFLKFVEKYVDKNTLAISSSKYLIGLDQLGLYSFN